ncbi:S1/P1 nuclease [Lactarius quietus]|nr:S1/P1 nuclease [Lactarius quietus]
MKFALPCAFAAALVAPCGVAAWGNLGHQTTGFSLGPAATWADTVRSETAFKFSAPSISSTRWVNSPPTSCSVNYARDCGASGCVVSAIQNCTNRVQTQTDPTQVQQALLFITHFIGDIGQPLHTRIRSRRKRHFCNLQWRSTNLHAAWDTGMLTTNVNALYSGSAQTWANNLATRITSGEYESLAAGGGTMVPLGWAQEANAYDCVSRDFYPWFSICDRTDLCTGTYFNNTIPVIDLQIAKQGYRMAIWLNTIFG